MIFVTKLVILIILSVFYLITVNGNKSTNGSSKVLVRGKRYLDYLDKSRMFFRVNVKNNIIKVNQLWAHGYGFRANYPIENDKEHRPFRRSVYETVEQLMDQY